MTPPNHTPNHLDPSGSPLPLRRLGATQLEVSAIGLGCMSFAGRGFVERVYQAGLSQDAATTIVESALASGITWCDTAEMYGRGHADGMLATALREARSNLDEDEDECGDIVIATKWNPVARAAASIERGIDPRLRALKLPILHQIHWPHGSLSPLRKQLHELARLYHRGAIQGVGVSNFSATKMRTAHDIFAEHDVPLATNQIRASLLCRDIETNGVLNTARELGITLIAYFPLDAGILTGRFHRDPDAISATSRTRRQANGLNRKTLDRTAPLITALHDIGDRYNMSPAQVALNWLITHYGDTVIAIPGASSAWHAVDNAHTMRHRLTTDDLDRLTEASTAYRAT